MGVTARQARRLAKPMPLGETDIVAEDRLISSQARYVFLLAGLSVLPGTAASAALNPIFEWVPSQKGLLVDAPHRQR